MSDIAYWPLPSNECEACKTLNDSEERCIACKGTSDDMARAHDLISFHLGPGD